MKVLFLHLSDMHCKESTNINNVKVDKIVQSVLGFKGKIDEVIIICSGDITWSGKVNEFKAAKTVLGYIIGNIASKLELNKFINFIVVPGNHDIDMTKLDRTSSEILDYYKEKNVDTYFYEEIKCMSNFFKYSKSKKCFTHNDVCESINIKLKSDPNYQFRINIINTAPFSTLKADNKEVHYIPDSEMTPLYRDENCSICITVMHHSTEWFHWDVKERLENILYRNSDIIFQGHEHLPHNISLIENDNNKIHIFKGGELSIDNAMASQYGIVILDTEASTIDEYLYTWDYKTPIFKEKQLSKNKKLFIKSSLYICNKEFTEEFYKDKHNLCDSFLSYYVFPKIYYSYTDEDKTKGVLSEDQLFNEIHSKEIIEIKAEKNAGKTSFLRYLYSIAQNYKLVPLYIGADEYPSFKVDKIIKRTFCDQYDECDYDKFKQLPKERKLLLIDDADSFSNLKLINMVLSKLTDEVGHIIFTSGDNYNADIIENAKDIINMDHTLQLSMSKFYKEKRQQLVTNICRVTTKMNDTEINDVVNFIDNMVHRRSGIFSLSPEFIITYLKYFLANNRQKSKQDDVFNKIFETNIYTSIIESTSKNNVDLYISVLSEIAHEMHFSKKESIQDSELSLLISKYNDKYKKKIIAGDFLECMIKSKILERSRESLSIKFSSFNYMAYFIAIKVSRDLERNPSNYENLNYIVRNICFGINDTILLFLSYIRSNVQLIYILIEEVKNILSDIEELNFDKNNIKILKAHENDYVNMPSLEDRRKIDRLDEQQEIIQYNNTLEYKSIYDYNDTDVNKKTNRFIRARKCIEIISKSIVSLNSTLESSDIDKIVDFMYRFPNKLLYSFLKPYDDNSEKIVEELKNFVNSLDEKVDFSEEELRRIISTACIAVTLGVYDNIAYFGSDINTIDYLCEYKEYSSNIKIQKLLMYEASSSTESFVQNAIEVFESTDDWFIHKLVRLVVSKHIINNEQLDHRILDRISSKLFNGGKKNLLLISSKSSEP